MVIRDLENDRIVVISSIDYYEGCLTINCYPNSVDFVFAAPISEQYSKYNIDKLKRCVYEKTTIAELYISKKDMDELSTILRQLANDRKHDGINIDDVNYSYIVVDDSEYDDGCLIGVKVNEDVDYLAVDFLIDKLAYVNYTWKELLDLYWMNKKYQ